MTRLGMQYARLTDVCTLITDGTHFSPPSETCGDFLYLTSKNVREGALVLTNVSYVKSEIHETIYSGCPVQFGDVLFVKDGVNAGLTAINTLKEPFSMLSSVALLRPNDGKLDARFLMHWLNNPFTRRQMLRNMSGAAIKRLVLGQIRETEILLPPLAEQRLVAAIVDQADDLRRKRREASNQLSLLREAIYRDNFQKEGGKHWQKIELQFVARSDDDIKCGPFGTQLRQSKFRSSGVPLWGIKHVNAGFKSPTVEFLSEVKAAELVSYDIRSGDIVMTRKGTIGNCAIYPYGLSNGVMHSDLLRLRLDKTKCDPVFVASQFQYSHDVSTQLSLISGGAIMPGINVGRLKALKIIAPPLDLQRAFAARIAEIDKLKVAHRAHLEKLNTLFASLQDRAFRGELTGQVAMVDAEFA